MGSERRHLEALVDHGRYVELPPIQNGSNDIRTRIVEPVDGHLHQLALRAACPHHQYNTVYLPGELYRLGESEKGWGVDNGLYVQVENSDYAAGQKCGRALVEMGNRPDAALFHNDLMAMGAISVLHDAKIKVPDDFSVIAFGNLSVAETLKISLTTISLATYKIGQKAAEVLLEKIKKQTQKSISDIAEGWVPQAIHLMPKLIIRETTAPRK